MILLELQLYWYIFSVFHCQWVWCLRYHWFIQMISTGSSPLMRHTTSCCRKEIKGGATWASVDQSFVLSRRGQGCGNIELHHRCVRIQPWWWGFTTYVHLREQSPSSRQELQYLSPVVWWSTRGVRYVWTELDERLHLWGCCIKRRGSMDTSLWSV